MATALLPTWALTFLFLAGGPVSLPLSLPPLPEDPVLAKAAPEQCLWYAALSGVDKADPASKNKVEQLLAEDDVQHFLHELAAKLQTSFVAGAPKNPLGKVLGEEGPKLMGTLLSRPLAAYIASVSSGPHGPTPRAGLIVNLGDKTAETQASLEKINQLIPHPPAASGSDSAAETAKSGQRDFTPVAPGATADASGWHTLPTPPDAPVVQWGIKNQYLVIGIGEGEADALWARTSKSPPAWLTEIKSKLKVDRPAMVQYLNAQTLVGMAQMALAAQQGPEMSRRLSEALGMQNVKYVASVGGLDQTSYVNHALVAIDGQPSGLLALVGGQSLDTSSLDPIPADASSAMAVRADVSKIVDAIINVASAFEPQARQQFEGSMQQLSQMSGINIKDDLLGSLGDTWCVYNSPDDGGVLFMGLTITATIRDRAKLQRVSDQLVSLSKVMDQRRNQTEQENPFGPSPPVQMMDETEFRGQKIVYVSKPEGEGFPFAPAWCVTDKQLVFALFPQTIKSYLQRQTADGKGSSSGQSGHKLVDVPDMAAVFSGGAGPTMVSYQDTANQFKFYYPLVQIFTQMACSQLQRQGVNLSVGMLPNSRAILSHLTPSISTVRMTPEGIRFDSHGVLPTGIGSMPLLAVPLLLPAVQAAREAAQRNQSMNNMKQIALAMLNFEDTHKAFPAAVHTSKDGKPLLSWRVMILPQLEEAELFKQFKLDEPWDSENNKKLIEKMPETYKAPGSNAAADFKTVYLTVRGDTTAFPGDKGIKLTQISDGTSMTIMAVEAPDDKAVIWTKPDDFELDQADPVAALTGQRAGGFLAVFCDGHVQMIPQSTDADTFKALCTRNGGEPVQLP